MGPTLAIAFGAGLASALLFATLASGNPLAIVLFYFAALPVLIAGLGWGHYAGGFSVSEFSDSNRSRGLVTARRTLVATCV